MKKSIPEYIKALSDNDFEILEEIFCEKYSQMIELYWLIRGYSDVTSSLTYDKCDNQNTLKIQMVLVNVKPKDVVKNLNSNIEDGTNVNIWNVGKVIHIEITKDDESEESEVE